MSFQIAVRRGQHGANALQRTTSLMHLPQLLADFGVTLPQLDAACPVPPQVWTDPAHAMPMARICAVLDTAARLAACPHLGLLLGMRVDASLLGLPGSWLSAAPTLRDALQGFIQLQPANTRAAALFLLDHGPEAFLGYGIYDRLVPGREQVYAMSISLTVAKIRHLTGGRANPAEVYLPFRAPPDAAIFDRLLGAPVRFGQSGCGILLTRTALDCPTVNAPAGARLDDWLLRLHDLVPSPAGIWTRRTQHALRPLLSRQRALRDDVARHLGLAPRTLNRRLQAEGTSLRDLIEEQRFIVAEELLLLTDMRLGEIALALGFEAEGSFFRSFRRWTGTTPDNWRQSHASPLPDRAAVPDVRPADYRIAS